MRFSLQYQDIESWCSGVFQGVRITRVRNLATVVFGLIVTRQCRLSTAARCLGNGKSYNTNRQRLKRFFAWKTVNLRQVSAILVPLVIFRFPKSKPVSVILDTTSIFWKLNCLTAAVPWRGRALPVAAILYWEGKGNLSQNQIEENFVVWLLKHVPDSHHIVIVADRGFGRTNFMEFLIQQQVLFVLRVKSKVTIHDHHGKATLLSRHWVKCGHTRFLEEVHYRADGAVVINIVISRTEGAKETWYLATNLDSATDALTRYEQRFQIEETFKDAKHQLGLEHCWLTNISRVGKMVAALLIAILILLWIGNAGEKFRYILDSSNTLSLISIALYLIAFPPPSFRRLCLTTLNQAQKGAQI